MSTDFTPIPGEAYADLGRRLASAYTSWHMGYKGVDHIMHKYKDHPIHEAWAELGKRLHHTVLPIDKAQSTPRLTLVK